MLKSSVIINAIEKELEESGNPLTFIELQERTLDRITRTVFLKTVGFSIDSEDFVESLDCMMALGDVWMVGGGAEAAVKFELRRRIQ